MIAVSINGKVIRKWTDHDGFVGEDAGVRIVHQGRGAVRIANACRGVGRPVSGTAHADVGAEKDLVKLINNDRMEGTVTGVVDDKLLVKTPEGNSLCHSTASSS